MSQKQELTLAQIKKDIFDSLRSYFVANICGAAIIYPIFILLAVCVWNICKDRSANTAVTVILVILIIAIPTVVGIAFILVPNLKRRRMIRDGEILVVEDELARISYDERVRSLFSRNVRYVTAYYFATYGRVEIGSSSELIYTNERDKFYVVMYNDGKGKIERVYNRKIYEFVNK